jgi:hypothetical protein
MAEIFHLTRDYKVVDWIVSEIETNVFRGVKRSNPSTLERAAMADDLDSDRIFKYSTYRKL